MPEKIRVIMTPDFVDKVRDDVIENACDILSIDENGYYTIPVVPDADGRKNIEKFKKKNDHAVIMIVKCNDEKTDTLKTKLSEDIIPVGEKGFKKDSGIIKWTVL